MNWGVGVKNKTGTVSCKNGKSVKISFAEIMFAGFVSYAIDKMCCLLFH